MNRILLPVMLLALAACAGDPPTAPSPDAPALARNAPTGQSVPASVPISGRCELTTLATTPSPAPPAFQQLAVGTCDLAHLGRATVHFTQVVNFATGTQHSLELTYTAADGDTLRAASTGTSVVSAGGVRFSATITFLGGTGRFVHATGQAHADGTASLTANTSEYTLDGNIAYDAADRSGP